MNLTGILSYKMKLVITLRWLRLKVKGRKPTYRSRVYKSAEELPDIKDDTWNHPFWIEHVLNGLKQNASDQSVELNIHYSGLANAVYVACLARGTTDRPVTILDLGGGVGIYYPMIKRVTSKLGVKIKYAVVDGAENCRNGNAFHNALDEIRLFDFNDNGIECARQFLGKTDVCNISSTLHYILDWQSALKNACELNPYAICISRAATPDHSDTEGYVIQHVTSSIGYCGEVKVVLIPRAKLVCEMQRLGYELLSEQGNSGDGNWFWEEGCSDPLFFQQTHRQFLFFVK